MQDMQNMQDAQDSYDHQPHQAVPSRHSVALTHLVLLPEVGPRLEI